MKKLFVWLCMMTKRQFKQPTFLCLLLLIPVLVFGYTALTQGQNGVVTVALAFQDEDALAGSICHKLQEESMLIRFQMCDPGQAEEMVKLGKADAAWIFPADTKAALTEFAKGEYKPFIRVLEREQSTSLQLCREKLAAAVFVAGSELFYENYLRENVPALTDVPAAALMEHYHNIVMDGELFQFQDITGAQERLEDQKSYLLSPLRGLLGVMAAVCAIASAMHYCNDLEQGVFSWIRQGYRPFIEFAGQAIGLVPLLITCAACLAGTGLAESFCQEMLVIIVYAFCCSWFGMMLRVIFKSKRAIATALPLICVAMLAVSDVFFSLPQLQYYALLLPATYYINGSYSVKYLFGGTLYGMVCLILYFLFRAIKKGVS